MKRIKLTVAYDGTNYCGWQIQPNGMTIESVLDKAIEQLTGEKTHVIGASRTDAGVSAYGNVAVFDTESTIPGDKFAYALNRYMPDDVSIVDSCETELSFHPRHCDTKKTYEYKILCSKFPIPQLRNSAWHIPYRLDVEKMRQAASYLIGEHDFKSFACVRTDAETTVRTIYSLEVEERALFGGGVDLYATMTDYCAGKSHMNQVYESGMYIQSSVNDAVIYTIRVCGNGFLYNMVRIIAGTLMQAGRGQLEPEQVKAMLESMNRTVAGQTAPPQGLTLMGIEYL